MIGDRVRNAPILTLDDAANLFGDALTRLPEDGLVSFDELTKALASEFALVLALSGSETREEKIVPPWVKG